MKKQNARFRNRTSSNLFVTGCGFFIVALIGYYFIGYEKEHHYLTDLAYQELRKTDRLITDEEVYDFMNQALLGRIEGADSTSFAKIICYTIRHDDDLLEAIRDLPDSLLQKREKDYLKDQVIKETFVWDNTRLNNAWLLTPSQASQVKGNDSADYWEEFRARYGNGGKHCYSKPIFSKERTLALIAHSGQGDWLIGSGEIMVFIKVGNRWTLFKEFQLWIS